MLNAKVEFHAIRETIKIPHSALILPQMYKLVGVGPALQAPFSSHSVANARDILADSKIMKNKSSNTIRILALGERKPRGLLVYSSQVK